MRSIHVGQIRKGCAVVGGSYPIGEPKYDKQKNRFLVDSIDKKKKFLVDSR